MKHDWRFCAGAGNYLNAGQDNEMREPGLEPGSLAAPDPKAHSEPLSTAAQGRKVAPGATRSTPDDTPGTTAIATREIFSTRATRSQSVRDGFKEAATRKECQSCRWRPPKGLSLLPGPSLDELLHAHHVVPLACGGRDEDANLVLLCPRCHAVAHRLGRMGDPWEGVRSWNGPLNADHLLYELRLLRDDRAWSDYVERGRPFVVPGERHFALERGGSPL